MNLEKNITILSLFRVPACVVCCESTLPARECGPWNFAVEFPRKVSWATFSPITIGSFFWVHDIYYPLVTLSTGIWYVAAFCPASEIKKAYRSDHSTQQRQR